MNKSTRIPKMISQMLLLIFLANSFGVQAGASGWVLVGTHRQCDKGYLSGSSGIAVDEWACQKSCDDEDDCRSVTYYTTGSKWCSHFSTTCTKRSHATANSFSCPGKPCTKPRTTTTTPTDCPVKCREMKNPSRTPDYSIQAWDGSCIKYLVVYSFGDFHFAACTKILESSGVDCRGCAKHVTTPAAGPSTTAAPATTAAPTTAAAPTDQCTFSPQECPSYARQLKVSSCTASSEYTKSRYGCMNAFKGENIYGTMDSWATKRAGQGSWIQANFPDEATVTKFQYVQRHTEHNKAIRLTFSDGSSQDFELESSTSVQTLVLDKVAVTTFVKITVLSTYPKYPWFTGANEIIFYGCAQPSPDPITTDPKIGYALTPDRSCSLVNMGDLIFANSLSDCFNSCESPFRYFNRIRKDSCQAMTWNNEKRYCTRFAHPHCDSTYTTGGKYLFTAKYEPRSATTISWAAARNVYSFAGKECDQAAGEVYLQKESGKVSSRAQCLRKCRESSLCKSLTYWGQGGWCSIFSTKCKHTKNAAANAVSLSRVESKSTTATLRTQTLFGKSCPATSSGYLDNSPGFVNTLATCTKTCEASPQCMVASFFANEWCSHYDRDCKSIDTAGAVTVKFSQSGVRTDSFSHVAGKECDSDAGEWRMSSSPGLVSLGKCLDECKQNVWCKSITYYESGWCNHFSTACENTRKQTNAASFRKVPQLSSSSWNLVDRSAECDAKNGEIYLRSSPGEDKSGVGLNGCMHACDLSTDCQSVTYYRWWHGSSRGWCSHFSTACENTKDIVSDRHGNVQSFRKVTSTITGAVVNTVECTPDSQVSEGGVQGVKCPTCAKGSYRTGGTWGLWCKKCVAGRYLRKSSAGQECIACPAGYTTDGDGKSAVSDCSVCAAGYYLNDKGESVACPAGTFNAHVGKKSLSSCIACPAGQYQSELGQSQCLECASGHYQPETGQKGCFGCTAVFSNPGSGKTSLCSCSTCPEGRTRSNTFVKGKAACINN